MYELEKIKQREDVNPKEGENEYGDVEFADTKNKKYPIDTKEHVQAALRYIGMPKNRSKYSAEDLSTIEGRIHAAARKFGIDSDSKKKSADFSFFANLVKAYTDEEGNSYIVGEASGPELDEDGEKMAKSAIECMMKCIHDRIVGEDGSLINVPLNDAHYHDGVLKELGQIISAELTDKYHLLIKAILDMDNPAAVSLMKQLRKGKQFGLSVAGIINDAKFVWDEAVQRSVRQFMDVSLEEISVTSRPSWSESYVAVLTKSAKSYLTQENTMKTTETLPETAKAAVNQETKNLVEETKKTESVKAEEKIEKAKDLIKPKQLEVMRKKVAHLHDHLASMAHGDVEPEEELPHVVAHAKGIASTLSKMANGDCSDFDGMDLDGMGMTPYYSLSHQDDQTGKVEKSDDASQEEATKVEEPVVETTPVEEALPEAQIVEVEPEKTQDESTEPTEEEVKEESPATKEKSAKTESIDVEEVVKAAVKVASETYQTEINALRAEMEDLKKTPNEPKGRVKAEVVADKSRVLGEEKATAEGRKAAYEAALKAKPDLSFQEGWRILNGVE